MTSRIVMVSSICLFLFFSFAKADDTDWEVSETIDISKMERVVFQKVALSEGAEWAATKGEILIEEAEIPGRKYKTKKYLVQNIQVVTDNYNAFVSPDKIKLIFLKDKKLYEYYLATNKKQLLGDAQYIKQIPAFVEAYLCFRLNVKRTRIINNMAKEEFYLVSMKNYSGNENQIGTVKVTISKEDGGGLNPLNWVEINYQNSRITLSGRFIETATFNIK